MKPAFGGYIILYSPSGKFIYLLSVCIEFESWFRFSPHLCNSVA